MSCTHKNIIDDQHTGDIVCTDCGIVTASGLPAVSSYYPDENPRSWSTHPSQYHIMLDFVFNACVPCRFADDAYEIYRTVTKTHLNRSRWTNKSDAYHIYASMYVALQNAGSCFTIREICGVCGLKAHELSRVIAKNYTHLLKSSLHPFTSDIVERFAAKLDLPTESCIILRKRAKDLEENHSSFANPLTIAACLIHKYCQEHSRLTPHLNKICQVIGVKQASVRRVLPRFD